MDSQESFMYNIIISWEFYVKYFITGAGGQLGHDVMNELAERGHQGMGSDIAPQYSGIQDGSAVTRMPYAAMDITDAAAVERVISDCNPDVVIHCAVLDVAVNLRPNSPTYKKWVAVELSEENKRQLMIPRGFGHGFVTLTDHVEFLYKADNYYAPEADGGIRWNDPEIGVEWGVENPILSQKDENNPWLKDAETGF